MSPDDDDKTEETPKPRRRRRKAASEDAPASEGSRSVEAEGADEPEETRQASDADATPAAPVAEAEATPDAADADSAVPEPAAESEDAPSTPDEDEELESETSDEDDSEDEDEDEDEGEDEEAEAEAAPKPARRRRRGAAAAADEAPAPAPTRRRAPRPPGPPPVVRAQAKYVRSSPRKARLVCDHIRGKTVEEARAILALTPRSVAKDWSKLLESAVANAEHNHELVGEDLYVKAVHADDGPTIKRFRPRAMGRATKIRKRTSHLTILLTPKDN
jgi:ribosomal protein L22